MAEQKPLIPTHREDEEIGPEQESKSNNNTNPQSLPTQYSTGTMKESHDDPMVRDKKELPLSGPSVVLSFILFAFILTPLWLVVLVPITLLCQAVLYVTRLLSAKPKKTESDRTPAVGEDPPVLMKSSDTNGRTYDLILFGATGFTGKMAAIYLAKNYATSGLRWAIAGRRLAGLEKVRDELSALNPTFRDLPIVIADSSNLDSLHAMTKQTKTIITTAGPFDKYGSKLVQSCAQNGTHYCDITGETDWVRKMIDQFDDVARQSGARIVPFCGHDCVPWDLMALECAKQLKQNGEAVTSIRFYDEINSAPSGGTLATVFHALGNRIKYKSRLGFDPLQKSATTGGKSDNKLVPKLQSMLGYSKEYKRWVGPFVMAMVMANCIRRSNAVNNYGSKVVYHEAAVYPSFMAGFVSTLAFLMFGTLLFCPPLKWLFLTTGLLPSPGQGPSEADMDQGFLKVTGFASGSSGGEVKAMMYFPTDPGYRDTARMLVESGLCFALAADEKQIKVGGGVWTAASCQGEVLMKRLVDTGCSFTIY